MSDSPERKGQKRSLEELGDKEFKEMKNNLHWTVFKSRQMFPEENSELTTSNLKNVFFFEPFQKQPMYLDIRKTMQVPSFLWCKAYLESDLTKRALILSETIFTSIELDNRNLFGKLDPLSLEKRNAITKACLWMCIKGRNPWAFNPEDEICGATPRQNCHIMEAFYNVCTLLSGETSNQETPILPENNFITYYKWFEDVNVKKESAKFPPTESGVTCESGCSSAQVAKYLTHLAFQVEKVKESEIDVFFYAVQISQNRLKRLFKNKTKGMVEMGKSLFRSLIQRYFDFNVVSVRLSHSVYLMVSPFIWHALFSALAWVNKSPDFQTVLAFDFENQNNPYLSDHEIEELKIGIESAYVESQLLDNSGQFEQLVNEAADNAINRHDSFPNPGPVTFVPVDSMERAYLILSTNGENVGENGVEFGSNACYDLSRINIGMTPTSTNDVAEPKLTLVARFTLNESRSEYSEVTLLNRPGVHFQFTSFIQALSRWENNGNLCNNRFTVGKVLFSIFTDDEIRNGSLNGRCREGGAKTRGFFTDDELIKKSYALLSMILFIQGYKQLNKDLLSTVPQDMEETVQVCDWLESETNDIKTKLFSWYRKHYRYPVRH